MNSANRPPVQKAAATTWMRSASTAIWWLPLAEECPVKIGGTVASSANTAAAIAPETRNERAAMRAAAKASSAANARVCPWSNSVT